MSEIDFKEINKAVNDDPEGYIRGAETEYMTSLGSAADALEASGARIVLLAGPSSSGKTTTANILRDHLADRGHETAVVSMDNFYRDKDDPAYPQNEDGGLDYEAVSALHTDKIHDCIATLLKGGAVKIPKYIFGEGMALKDAIPISLPAGGFVIMEGLHALNPIITDGLDRSQIIKIFISVSTNINDGERRILSGRKIRFVRRMTRDSLYRGTDAASTLARWHSVLEGEDKYLYPFKNNADLSIDTFHRYEIGVMKPFAMRALEASREALGGEYIDIIRNALSKFDEVDLSSVPDTSLIREFVPGGKYESLY